MEIRRARGVATFLTYPLKDGNGSLVSGVTTLRPQYATFTDSNPISTISNIAGFCAELGATGIYYSSISASEMANDYVYFVASPSSGSARRFDVLINCTKIASVQAVSDVVTATISSGTGTGQLNLSNGRPGINWADIVNASTTQTLSATTIASVNNVATCTFVASVSAAVLSNVGTVTGVTNSVSVGTVTGVTNSVGVREGTGGNQVNLSSGRVGINWNDIINPTSTQTLSGTTIASANNVATCQFVASVSSAVLSNVGTVTGVTNSVNANVGTITGVTNSVSVSTITGVTNSVGIRTGTGGNQLNTSSGRVGINWGDILNPTATTPRVDLWAWNGTAPRTLSNQYVQVDLGSVVNSVSTAQHLSDFFDGATGYAASLSSVGTISGVTNRVDATLTQEMQSMIADRFLSRSIARGSDGGRTIQDAFRLLRNRRGLQFGAMSTATLTAFQEDDATAAWTALVSTSSAVGLTDIDAS